MDSIENLSQASSFDRGDLLLEIKGNLISYVTIPNIVVALSLYYSSLVFYRLYLHPLAKFPGPKLAAASRWYEAYYDLILGGKYTWQIREMHKKYGPIIRISPYELHVIDPKFYEKLYCQDGWWDKYDWSYDAFGAPLTAVSTPRHDIHKQRRTPLNSFFSKPNVTRKQELLKRNLDRLVGRLDGFVTSRKRLNLNDALSAFARDVSAEFMLGRCPGNLDHDDFNARMTQATLALTKLWMVTKHFRWVGGTLMSLPIPVAMIIGGKQNQPFFAFLEWLLKDTAILMAKAKSEDPDPDAPFSLVHAIVQSKLPAPEKRHRRVAEEVSSILGAGFETTATVMRIVLYHMYNHPAILARLRSELESAGYTSRGLIPGDLDWVKLQQLPYLTAILQEGLRMGPGVASRLARIAPDRDLFYENWCIPAGTPVGMTTILMHHDEQLYSDPKSFIPDRWLDPEARRKADKSYAPFSRGTRNCLGMHLAWSELYMLVATFALLFDFEFDGAGPKDVEITVDHFTIGTEDQSGIMTWVKRHQ
ncbi:trichodiene oxygenase [Xylaria arbuscula]|nr:trichodiene oxygenase [Xylaria arbuscula]